MYRRQDKEGKTGVGPGQDHHGSGQEPGQEQHQPGSEHGLCNTAQSCLPYLCLPYKLFENY